MHPLLHFLGYIVAAFLAGVIAAAWLSASGLVVILTLCFCICMITGVLMVGFGHAALFAIAIVVTAQIGYVAALIFRGRQL